MRPKINAYDVGDVVRLSVTTASMTEPGDPDVIACRVLLPDELTVETFTFGVDAGLVKDGIGSYYLDYPITKEGIHRYRWEASGNIDAAEAGAFAARPKVPA